MTETIHQWLDPAEVRRLAEQLLPPARKPRAGTTPAATPPAADSLAGAPANPTPTAAPAEQQLPTFNTWLQQHVATNAWFLFDRDGEIRFEHGSHSHLHFFARSLATLSRRQSISLSHVQMTLAAESVLAAIPLQTPAGCSVLGLVVAGRLAADTAATVRDALEQLLTQAAS